MRRHPVALIVDDDGDTAEMYAIGLSVEGLSRWWRSTEERV